MIPVLGIVGCALSCWIFVRLFRDSGTLRFFFLPALALKCLAGLALGAIYYYYYQLGDTIQFFEESLKLNSLAKSRPGDFFTFIVTSTHAEEVPLAFTDLRAIFMVKIVSVFGLFAFENYWFISLYMSVVSFFGSWYFVRQVHHYFPAATIPGLLAVLFFPSIVFWTSGVIKESLAMASLFFICGVFIKFWCGTRIKITEIIVVAIAIVVLWKLKYYFAGIFLLVTAAAAAYRVTLHDRDFLYRPVVRTLVWLFYLLLLVLPVTFLHPNFKPGKLLVVMAQNAEAFVKYSDSDEVIHFVNLEPSVSSFLVNAPNAMFSGLFRPFLWEATNLFSCMIALENLLILGCAIIAFPSMKKLFEGDVAILLQAIVVYVILLSVFITLSTPNFGTLARYRVGYLPLFVFLIFLAPPIRNRLQQLLGRFVKKER